ncbi:hypothetical protein [Streptomyces sp. NPDC047123]|uniref:hypothetical protein n=1 Tax=Streptomyces sp. NPDC047123 TaxID=3155622 RepID=UPI0033DFCF0C
MLVTTFSVGLGLGAVTTLDLSWNSEPAGRTAVSAPRSDLSWHSQAQDLAWSTQDLSWGVGAGGTA